MAFRSKPAKNSGSSSESDDAGRNEDSGDDDRFLHWKRVRTNNNLPDLVPPATSTSNVPDVSVVGDASVGSSTVTAKTRKVNTIWADVTAEQELSRTMSGNASVFVKNQQNTVYRGPETYYVRKRRHDEQTNSDRRHNGRGRDNQESYFRAKRVGKKEADVANETSTMSYEVAIDKSDSVEVLGTKLASALREPKVDLMIQCVKVLGIEKCTELFSEVVKIEKTGGMLTMDLHRRRSPGGVFLQLIREDKSISDEKRKQLFVEQREVNRKLEHAKRRTKRHQNLNKNHRSKNFDQLLLETKSKIVENKSRMEIGDKDSDSDSREWPDKKEVFLAEALEVNSKTSRDVVEEEGELLSNGDEDEDSLVACT